VDFFDALERSVIQRFGVQLAESTGMGLAMGLYDIIQKLEEKEQDK
jgi:hypothetical protein